VVFSHGFRGIRWQSTFLTVFLASFGYVVAAPDHEGNTIFDGSAPAEQSAADRVQDMALVTTEMVARARSASGFFAAAFDPLRVAWTGHSFGASTDIMAGALDNREVVNIPLAPAFDDRMAFVYRQPSYDLRAATFIFGGTEDTTVAPSNQQLAYDRTVAPRHLVMLRGAKHFDFTDMCANDTLRLIPQLGKNCGPQTKEAQTTLRSLVVAALHRYLRCDPQADAWLDPPSVTARPSVDSYSHEAGAKEPAIEAPRSPCRAEAETLHEDRTLARADAPPLHVALGGRADATALVFVHGLGATGAVFARQAASLAARFRIVRIDLRGHGDSGVDPTAPFGPDGIPGTADDPYRLDAFARDVEDAVSLLGLSRAVVVGWSSGAQAAVAVARGPLAPRVRGLVLVGFAPLTAPDAARHPKYNGGGTLAFARDVRLAALEPPAATWGPVVEHFFAAPAAPPLVSEFLGVMSQVPLATRRGQLATRPDLVDALGSVSAPTLIVHGEQDDAVLLESARFAAASIPNAKLVVFQRSGHAPFAEEPEHFDRAVTDFVAQLPP
jgi:pimeloyl-ACP methyl ester carboxylesterase